MSYYVEVLPNDDGWYVYGFGFATESEAVSLALCLLKKERYQCAQVFRAPDNTKSYQHKKKCIRFFGKANGIIWERKQP